MDVMNSRKVRGTFRGRHLSEPIKSYDFFE